jgi:hypothetical protein
MGVNQQNNNIFRVLYLENFIRALFYRHLQPHHLVTRTSARW